MKHNKGSLLNELKQISTILEKLEDSIRTDPGTFDDDVWGEIEKLRVEANRAYNVVKKLVNVEHQVPPPSSTRLTRRL